MKLFCKDSTVDIMCTEYSKHLPIDRTYLKKFIDGDVRRIDNESGEMIGIQVIQK